MDKLTLKQRARDLRKNSTEAERHLWYFLRANRLGFKFKRQVPIGMYIVDFFCFEKRLIIELDGSQHMGNKSYDMKRTDWLMTQGFDVLRFCNHDVFQQTPAVLETIWSALLHNTPSPQPSSREKTSVYNPDSLRGRGG